MLVRDAIEDQPVSALLSKALVAYTIEFDNAFEQRMPHRTSRGPARRAQRGPWLVSMPMWSNFMRWLPADGAPAADLADLIELVNLPGLQRWSYVRVHADRSITPSRDGGHAQQLWPELVDELDARWTSRFGGDLHAALLAMDVDADLPWHLPVSGPRRQPLQHVRARDDGRGIDLATMLARVLMTFTADFEQASRLSLAVSANVLRVLGSDGVRTRDLPALTGTSRESVTLAVALLERHGLATITTEAGAKVARLTDAGEIAQRRGRLEVRGVEERWRERFGAAVVDRLRDALVRILSQDEVLAAALDPHPDGWRAHPPYAQLTQRLLAGPSAALPEYPVVSHRGGFPDGS